MIDSLRNVPIRGSLAITDTGQFLVSSGDQNEDGCQVGHSTFCIASHQRSHGPLTPLLIHHPRGMCRYTLVQLHQIAMNYNSPNCLGSKGELDNTRTCTVDRLPFRVIVNVIYVLFIQNSRKISHSLRLKCYLQKPLPNLFYFLADLQQIFG